MAYQIAEAHAFRGEADPAFEWLERAYEQRDGGVTEIKGYRCLRGLVGYPRYKAFSEEIEAAGMSVEGRRGLTVPLTVRTRWSFDSRGQCLHRVCERVTQPIRLVLPDLLQDRLAKLTEHAAHVDMIIGAVAQHGLRVAPVAQWLQWQAVRVLEPVDRALDASKQ